jgi:phosphoglycerate dehydrogenase-like enzyme
MRVMIGATAQQRYGDIITASNPSVELVVMDDDGSLHLHDSTVGIEDAGVDVAWASGDLFTEDGPASQFLNAAKASPTLRWFQSPAAGKDHPLYGQLMSRGIRVSSSHTQSVPIAEFVMRAVLDHFQDAPAWVAAQQRREWKRRRWREIDGTTWLVIGMGAIGCDVASRAKAFGAHVIGVRRNPNGEEPADEMLAPAEQLAAVPRADVIVLSAPSTPETRHTVNAAFLAAMKPDAFLVNVGRGALVDEAALIESLERGVPSGAALDVAEVEPLPANSPLWAHPRVAITPHNSATGDRTGLRAAQNFATNLARYIAEGIVPHEMTDVDVAAAPAVSPRGSERL